MSIFFVRIGWLLFTVNNICFWDRHHNHTFLSAVFTIWNAQTHHHLQQQLYQTKHRSVVLYHRPQDYDRQPGGGCWIIQINWHDATTPHICFAVFRAPSGVFNTLLTSNWLFGLTANIVVCIPREQYLSCHSLSMGML